MTIGVDRHELRQINAGVDGDVILVAFDRSRASANEAVLVMQGAETVSALAATVDADRARFALCNRSHTASLSRKLDVHKRSDAIASGRKTRFPSSQTDG